MVDPRDSDDDLDFDDADVIEDPLSLDQALPRFSLDRLVALFDDAAGKAAGGRGAEELRDLMLVAAFGPDAAYRYEQVFEFTPIDLLERLGAELTTVVEWSPQGEGYVTYGLTRVALGGRGYLVSWYTGDDDSRDWLEAGWMPATARAPYLRALRDQFRSSDDNGFPLSGAARTAGLIRSFDCAGDVLDLLWRERPRARWVRDLAAWVEAHARVAPGIEPFVSDAGDALIEAAGVGDPAAFVDSLLSDGAAVTARFAAREESRQDRRLLVLVRVLEKHHDLGLWNPALERAQAEWRQRSAPRPSQRLRAFYSRRFEVPPPRTDWIYVVTASFEKIWDRIPEPLPVRAAHAYVGDAFVANRAIAEASGRPWFILSPQHGLVAPDTKVTPDDLTFSAVGREAFIERTEQQAHALGVAGRPWKVLGYSRWRAGLASGGAGSD